MEIYKIDEDIKCFTVKAESFPEGIMAAHKKLHGLIPFSQQRKYYGISRPEGLGKISYWAGAEKLDGENIDSNELDAFAIKAGKYVGRDIKNFMSDTTAIGKTFQEILQDPRIDPEGYCLEWYPNMEDVRCMIPLK